MNRLFHTTTTKTPSHHTLFLVDPTDTGLPVQSGLVAGQGQMGELMACAGKCAGDPDCLKECRDTFASDLEIPEGIRKQFF